MLRVMIVDDEALARQGLRDEIGRCTGVEVCGEAGSMTQALQAIPALAPDALFLDIRMPHGNGFDLLKKLPAAPPVVFVTAHSEYAVQAFEVQAVDYLLKPVRPARLAEAVARLQSALGQGGEEPASGLQDERFRAALIEAIDTLPERERLLLSLYYDEELNLKEIGAVLGVSESRVSQLHSQCAARLRSKLMSWRND